MQLIRPVFAVTLSASVSHPSNPTTHISSPKSSHNTTPILGVTIFPTQKFIYPSHATLASLLYPKPIKSNTTDTPLTPPSLLSRKSNHPEQKL